MGRGRDGSDSAGTGIIFDVKRFATHDGPGIRTAVFLKGCALACPWCHNPESQRARREVLFWSDRCTGCGACVRVCSAGAVSVGGRVAATDRDLCDGCGVCVSACPERARAMVGESRTAAALLAEVERDVLFYDQSGGGLTLSGGEPLMQPEFALEVLRGGKKRRIATALDTSGDAPPDIVEEASRSTDLFLYDLKIIDGARHAAATGVRNERILDNARRLASCGARMWIRVPLIPGWNDDDGNIEAIGRFVRELGSAEAVQVLPYHRAGEAKRDRLERRRETSELAPPEAEDVERAVQILRCEARRPVTIGG